MVFSKEKANRIEIAKTGNAETDRHILVCVCVKLSRQKSKVA